jgi:polyribonucleotide 5'-hydroxyl-kinase
MAGRGRASTLPAWMSDPSSQQPQSTNPQLQSAPTGLSSIGMGGSSQMMNRKEWKLKPETELRCEVHESETLTVKLLDGTCEIFGLEVPQNKEFVLNDESVAFYSWYGCTLETICSGPESGIDVYDNTPMIAYTNVHIQLEAMRDVCAQNNELGPNVLVVGPPDSGKSSVARILAAYSARLDRAPVYVDLDVSQGNATIPGCLSAVVLEKSFVNVEVCVTLE